MTNFNMIDRNENLPGYFSSSWPVECGGNRRQKSYQGSLNAKGSSPKVQTLSSDKWNVMVIDAGIPKINEMKHFGLTLLI